MSFNNALSGLNAASTDLATTANNIANAATTGFKASRTEFADVFASEVQGVKVADVAQIFSQGSVEFTGNTLDLAINGTGFFALSNNGALEYSRAGAFRSDRDGFVVNSTGKRLQAFPPVQSGLQTTFNTGVLSDLQLITTESPPQTTTAVNVGVNLDAGQVAPSVPFDPNQPDSFFRSTSLSLFDSQGSPHSGTIYFVPGYDGVDPATANQWQSYLFVDGENVSTDGDGIVTPPAFESIAVTFNPDGTLAAVNGDPSGTFTFDNFSATLAGASPLSLTFDFSGTTQFGGGFSVNQLSQDGFAKGLLVGMDVSSEGIVFARFSNGQTQALGQVALAKFVNNQGLVPIGDNSWTESFASGNPLLGAAGSSNFGVVQGGGLEASNVDISEQLVRLIIAQRNFQANAESITTENQITQALFNI